MKKTIFALSILTLVVLSPSCKSENKDQQGSTEQTSSTNTSGSANEEAPKNNDTPTLTVTAVPDSASLGKNKEALVRIKDIKIIELTDPDGNSKGRELAFKVELTNRTPIGGNTIGVNTSDFRLELDNGQKVAPSSRYVSAQPEETKTSDEDKFEIPVGAKPVGLSLFMDDTRASIKLEVK